MGGGEGAEGHTQLGRRGERSSVPSVSPSAVPLLTAASSLWPAGLGEAVRPYRESRSFYKLTLENICISK